jgi:hypothetical protein
MHPIEPEELMAYLDGELAPERASEAAQHLLDCRECQAVAADVQSVSRKLVAWQVEEHGPELVRVVGLERLPERDRPVWRRRWPWVVGLAAAAGVVAILTVPTSRKPASYAFSEEVGWDRSSGWTAPTVLHRASASKGMAPQSEQKPVTDPSAAGARLASKTRVQEPLVIRTAQITLTTTDFGKARTSLEDILKRHGGHIGSLTVGSPADSGQTLQATLRVPSSQLDAALVEIRHLGRVENEQQGGEEVTQQVVDLEARLTNARTTETRLADILNRSGKISDVLAVENEIDRVRGEIERMEAERKSFSDRIDFATLDVHINEEYKAHLAVAAPSAFSGLHNAAVDGYRNVADSLTGVAMFLLSAGPVVVLWTAILFFPARYGWKRLRRARK